MAVKLAVEKGASSWLTAIPLDEYGFALHKSAFQDAIALRYMVGFLCVHLLTVLVENPSLWSIYCKESVIGFAPGGR